MSEPRQKKARIWERDPLEWYVEPQLATAKLLAVEKFLGSIHDPACGQGNVLEAAKAAGYPVSGCDIQKRTEADWWCGELDFLSERQLDDPLRYENIVTNPPFFRAKGTEQFIRAAHEDQRQGRRVRRCRVSGWRQAGGRTLPAISAASHLDPDAARLLPARHLPRRGKQGRERHGRLVLARLGQHHAFRRDDPWMARGRGMMFVFDAFATIIAVLCCLLALAGPWGGCRITPLMLLLLGSVFWLAGRHWWGLL